MILATTDTSAKGSGRLSYTELLRCTKDGLLLTISLSETANSAIRPISRGTADYLIWIAH